MNDLDKRLAAYEQQLQRDIARGRRFHDELREGGSATSAPLLVRAEIHGAEVSLRLFRDIVRGEGHTCPHEAVDTRKHEKGRGV